MARICQTVERRAGERDSFPAARIVPESEEHALRPSMHVVVRHSDMGAPFSEADSSLDVRKRNWLLGLPWRNGGIRPSAGMLSEKTFVRTNRWKLIYKGKSESYELYDLKNDQKEARNVVDQYPEIFEQLSEKLTERSFMNLQKRLELRNK